MAKHLVMYTRTASCPFVSLSKRVLSDYALGYQEIFIDQDDRARQRVLEWTGFLAVPTLVVAEQGTVLPFEAPLPLPRGASPRGVNRGSMITEPSKDELVRWLRQHDLIEADVGEG